MRIRIPRNFGRSLERLLRSMAEEALLEEIRRRIGKAAQDKGLSPSSKRQAVIAGLRQDGFLEGIPEHLVNLLIEMAVARLKQGG